jgi:uncharacterized protein (TIRG00374 family)
MSGAQFKGPRPSLKRRFVSWPTLISFFSVPLLLGLLFTRFELDWGSTWELIRSSNPWWFALAVLVHYSTFIFRGARWRLLIGNAAKSEGSSEMLPTTFYCGRVILMAWFANSVAWFRLGDAYRAYAHAEDFGASFPRSMGTVVADRVIDVVVVFGLLAAAAGILYVGGQVRPSQLFIVLAGLFLLAVTGTLLGMLFLRRWVARRLPHALQDAYHRFHVGTMGSFKRLHWAFILGVLGWLAEVGRLFFVLQALGVPVALGLVLFVTLANGLLTAVPLTPGGLGIVEPGITGLLMLSLVREEAVAVALLDRSISYLSIVAAGGVVFFIRQARIARSAVRMPVSAPNDGSD